MVLSYWGCLYAVQGLRIITPLFIDSRAVPCERGLKELWFLYYLNMNNRMYLSLSYQANGHHFIIFSNTVSISRIVASIFCEVGVQVQFHCLLVTRFNTQWGSSSGVPLKILKKSGMYFSPLTGNFALLKTLIYAMIAEVMSNFLLRVWHDLFSVFLYTYFYFNKITLSSISRNVISVIHSKLTNFVELYYYL